MSIDVPKFFTYKELIVTNTGLLNVPDNWETIMNLFSTGKYLDCLRTLYGHPITVDSGYRSPAVNRAVKGSDTSAHLLGLAADIRPAEGQLSSLLHVTDEAFKSKKLPIDQLIIHPDFLHLGFSERPRFQRWSV